MVEISNITVYEFSHILQSEHFFESICFCALLLVVICRAILLSSATVMSLGSMKM